MAEAPEVKQAKVDELRAAILAGNAEAEGLDATNPERQRMMEGWCASDDPARTADPKTSFLCAKAKAKSEFYKRREELLAFWCGEQGHAGSPKCKQMEFGKRMQSTESGEVRLELASSHSPLRPPRVERTAHHVPMLSVTILCPYPFSVSPV